MTATVNAPLTTIQLSASAPQIKRSRGIYIPVAPGIVYDDLPAVVIVDTSPDQIIGSISDTGATPQTALNAAFPSAIAGDGVIENSTNEIWVYSGSVWNNVGQTPGPTINSYQLILPYNETVICAAVVKPQISVVKFNYALNLLTEVPAIAVKAVSDVVRVQAVRAPVADIAFAAEVPIVDGGNTATVPQTDFALAAEVPSVT